MFSHSRPVFFDPRGARRPRRGPPRWLWLLLCGALVGAGALVYVQQRVLPPRLTSAESAALQQAFDSADSERQQLRAEQAQSQAQLQRLSAENAASAEALARSRASAERLRDDLVSVLEALPPDPRGGSVDVRAGQFSARNGALDYRVVLTRDVASAKPLTGVLQLTVAGESARGASTSLALQPISLTLDRHEVLRGSLPLPEGFKPRQTTVRVLDRAAGTSLGMRVLLVR